MGLARICRELPGCRVVLVYRDDRPYKRLLNALDPYVTDCVALPPGDEVLAPMSWFDGRPTGEGRPLGADWVRKGYHRPDVFLVPSMYARGEHIPFGKVPRFRFLPEHESEFVPRLMEEGLDPENWFVCLHMRESRYEYRYGEDGNRSVDPATYLPLIRHVVRERGGQVVRMGDPSMLALPEMEGFVDLSRYDDILLLQLFALSRARFFVGTDSGPVGMSGVFGVPTVSTNSIGVAVLTDGDAVLFKKMWTPAGRPIRFREFLDSGTTSFHGVYPIHVQIENNSSEELLAAAKHMMEETAGVESWRRREPEEPHEPGHGIGLPIHLKPLVTHTRLDFLNDYSAAPRPPAEGSDQELEALYEQNLEYLKSRTKYTLDPNRRWRIMAFFAMDELSDFIRQNILAAFFASRFANCDILAILQDDVDEARHAVLNANSVIRARVAFGAPGGKNREFFLDWFDTGGYAPVSPPSPDWVQYGMNSPDLVLIPPMLRANPALLEGLAEAPPLLDPLREGDGDCGASLLDAGISPGDWHAVVEMDGRTGLNEKLRGHEVDFSAKPVGERMAAVRDARFVVSSRPDTLAMASAFGVPAAAVDILDYSTCLWNRGDILLARKIVLDDGRVLGTRAAFEAGRLDAEPPAESETRMNDAETVSRVIDEMISMTEPRDRSGVDRKSVSPPNQIRFPLSFRKEPLFTLWD